MWFSHFFFKILGAAQAQAETGRDREVTQRQRVSADSAQNIINFLHTNCIVVSERAEEGKSAQSCRVKLAEENPSFNFIDK